MIKVVRDYTRKYANMLSAFNADNSVKVQEILEGSSIWKDINGKPYYDIEKDLIKNKDERLMKDIELLEELEFLLRHNKLKIVEVDNEKLIKEEII